MTVYNKVPDQFRTEPIKEVVAFFENDEFMTDIVVTDSGHFVKIVVYKSRDCLLDAVKKMERVNGKVNHDLIKWVDRLPKARRVHSEYIEKEGEDE